jgi:hypothetical protein
MIHLFDSTADILGVENKELRCIMTLRYNYLLILSKNWMIKILATIVVLAALHMLGNRSTM